MSSCNFSIPFTKPTDEILSKAKKAVESQNGSFEGDAGGGAFDVSVFGNTVKGTYRVEGSSLHIDISEKPFLVPCSVIESFLKQQLN